MYSKLIKKYKYIDKETVRYVPQPKVLKNADCDNAEYAQFYKEDPEYKAERSQSRDAKSDDIAVKNDSSNPADKKGEEQQANFDTEPVNTPDISAIINEQKKAIEQQLKSEYEARIKSEKQISYNEGMQEGKKAGKAENATEINNLRQLVTSLQTEFREAASKFFDEVEKLTMDMSVYLAKKIIGDAVAEVPDIVRTNVDKCVKLLAGSGVVQIKINPNDYDTIKSYVPELEQQSEEKFTFILEPDNKIERGGCMVEFEGSSIDGRIQTQIEKIQKQMEMIT